MTALTTSGTAIPTVGECASRALRDFVAIRSAQVAVGPASASHLAGVSRTPSAAKVEIAGGNNLDTVTRTSIDLLVSCLRLTEKFPHEARRPLVAALPFSTLEVELLQSATPASGTAVQAQIAHRVHEWITRSPVFVDEARVDVADFLKRLRPHLDSWDERAQIDEFLGLLSDA